MRKTRPEQIHIKVTPSQKRKLTHHAETLGLSLSAWIRLVLLDALHKAQKS